MSYTEQLAQWFTAQCNGEWEHSFGVQIETLDNPGWALHIDLTETPLVNKPFSPVRIDRTENDWIDSRIVDAVFHAYGGPRNLDELITIFLNWADH